MTSLDIRSARAATLAVTATLALLTLAACGGGGGGGTASNGGPHSPTLTDARSANGSAARNAGAQAATNLPSFGSVTQSTNAGSVAGISGDAASTSFDGRNVRVTVQRTDGSQLAFDGATDRIGGESYPPVLPGYSYRGDALLTSTATTLSVAAVYTNWNNADPTDYLAGGYWMHLEGRTDTLEITGADIGPSWMGRSFPVWPPHSRALARLAIWAGRAAFTPMRRAGPRKSGNSTRMRN